MLYLGSRIIVIFLIFALFFTGCNKYKTYDTVEINKLRVNIQNKSKFVVGSSQYELLYADFNDSINDWINNHIQYIEGYNINREWLLDSVICINGNGSKLIASVLKRSLYDGSNTDFIDYFYGVKIDETWYFFMGPHLVLPREFYQEDIYTPLSFEKLQQIATAHIYRGYLKKGKKGQWEINERFFQDITSVAWCTDCITQDDWDQKYLSIVRKNWQQRDTTNY